MDKYVKPYINEFYNREEKECEYPYARKLFKENNIFPLIILDGGAFFFLKERLGGEADSQTILDGIKSRKFFDIWTNNGKFDWNLPLKLFENSKLNKSWEWIVWINRLYFLLPLAQQFFRTGEEKWAEDWYKYFDEWLEYHPYQPLDGRDIFETDAIWRDMQVTWRCLILLHSVYLFSGSSYLNRGKWEKIYKAIELHASHLFEEGRKKIETRAAHNHVLQIGLVLLYVGVFFPEFEKSLQYTIAGKEIIKINLDDQIYADGGSAEACPSYSHFIARMYLEAFLIMEKNHIDGIDGLEESINRQYEWLYQASSPSNRSLQISDSYALDAKQDLSFVSKMYPLKTKKEKTSVHFKESGFAVLRNNRFDIYIDAIKQREGHQHFGRSNILVYSDKLPLLVDSGCCDYDRYDIRTEYLKQSFAHNVVVVPEFEETFESISEMAENLKYNSSVKITDFTVNDNESIVKIVHSFGNKGISYVWKRSVVLKDNKMKIIDRIDSENEITCKQVFHFAPWKMALSEDRTQAFIFLKTRDVTFEHANKNTAFQLDYKPAYDDNNNMVYSPTLTTTAKGAICEFEVLLTL